MRVAIRSGQRDDFLHRTIGQVQNVNVGGAPLDQIGVLGGIEGNLGSIRRPGEAADTIVLTLGALLTSLRLFESFGQVDGPEMVKVIFLPYNFKIAKVLFTVFRAFLLRRCGGEGDALAVRRPLEAVDAVLGLRQLHRLATIGRDGEDLVLVADAAAGKG